MHSNQAKRADSTTIFVSLSLAMLVLFVFLNTAAFPSKQLLRQVVPPPATPAPTFERPLFPSSLSKLIIRALTQSEGSIFQLSESTFLLDARRLSATPDGVDQKEELFRWLNTLVAKRHYSLELSCFIDGSAGDELAWALQNRRRECARSITEPVSNISPPSIRIVSREAPTAFKKYLQEKSLDIEQAYVLTLTRPAALS
jgi:hypothetical protein